MAAHWIPPAAVGNERTEGCSELGAEGYADALAEPALSQWLFVS